MIKTGSNVTVIYIQEIRAALKLIGRQRKKIENHQI